MGDRRWDQKSVITTSCLLHQENQLCRGPAEQSAGKYHVLREFTGPISQYSSPHAYGHRGRQSRTVQAAHVQILPDQHHSEIKAVSYSFAAKIQEREADTTPGTKVCPNCIHFTGIFSLKALVKMPFPTLQTMNQECPLFPQNAQNTIAQVYNKHLPGASPSFC